MTAALVPLAVRAPQIPRTHAVEPPYADAYFRWQQQPAPQTAGRLLQTLQPVLAQELRKYGPPNPLLTSQARKIALDALPRYDYTAGPLAPYVRSQLRGLQRVNAKQQQVINVPERIAMARAQLRHDEEQLRDSLGRDPADSELADHTGLSLQRIAYLRKYHAGVAVGQLAAASTDPDQPFEPAVDASQQRSAAIVRFVYDGLDDPIDRAVMEYALGLNGAKPLPVTEVARRLNRSPGAVSQRAAKLQAQLEELAAANIL